MVITVLQNVNIFIRFEIFDNFGGLYVAGHPEYVPVKTVCMKGG